MKLRANLRISISVTVIVAVRTRVRLTLRICSVRILNYIGYLAKTEFAVINCRIAVMRKASARTVARLYRIDSQEAPC